MTGTERDPAVVPDPYLTEHGLAGANSSWAPTGVRTAPTPGGAWENWAIFAGVMLLVAGLSHVFLGLVALFDASHFDPAESDPALAIGYSAWGWIHLVGGSFLIAAGAGMLRRKEWARLVAIVFAGLNAITALTFLPTAPLWGTLLIVLDVLVVYALTVHRAESSG